MNNIAYHLIKATLHANRDKQLEISGFHQYTETCEIFPLCDGGESCDDELNAWLIGRIMMWGVLGFCWRHNRLGKKLHKIPLNDCFPSRLVVVVIQADRLSTTWCTSRKPDHSRVQYAILEHWLPTSSVKFGSFLHEKSIMFRYISRIYKDADFLN